eukprot:103949-Pyramimonas_sp.AAC.1
MEGGSFPKCGSHLSAAHIRLEQIASFTDRGRAEFHWFPKSMYPKPWCGRIQEYGGATVTLIRGVEVPGMAFWHDSVPSRRNSQVDPWRWNPENN